MRRLIEIDEVIKTLEEHEEAIDLLDPMTIVVDGVRGKKVILVHCYYGDDNVQEWFQENREKTKIEKLEGNNIFEITVELGAMRVFALLDKDDYKRFKGVKNE